VLECDLEFGWIDMEFYMESISETQLWESFEEW
jgi:hypothetical protein